jgi:hypothetical protein
MTYEMAWKVKNEMQIGSSTRGTAIGAACTVPSSALTLSAKKLAYLNTPRTTRLTVTAEASRRAADGVP